MSTSFGRLTAEDACEKGYIPARVLVNGVETKNVSVVDDIEGWVDVYDFDKYHELQESQGEMDHVPLKRIYGEIIYIPSAAKGNS